MDLVKKILMKMTTDYPFLQKVILARLKHLSVRHLRQMIVAAMEYRDYEFNTAMAASAERKRKARIEFRGDEKSERVATTIC